MGSLHEFWKDEVKKILEHYGFDVKKEYPLQSGERIDVAGWCNREKPWRGKSVAVEIEKTSPLEKDVDKLRRSGFDLKFVVRFTMKELPAEFGDVIIVYPARSFENILRLMLKVPPTYPMSPRLSEALIQEPKPQRLAELLESLGLGDLTPKVEDALLKLYLAHPYGLSVRVGRQRPSGVIEFTETSDIEPQVRSILYGLELASELAVRGTYETGRVWELYLTDRGLEFGREVLLLRLRERDALLKSLIKDFNPKLIFAACIGFGTEVRKDRAEIATGIEEDPYLSSLDDAFFKSEHEPSDKKRLLEKFHISEPLHLYACYLANLPAIRRTISSYYERLLDAGLAEKISRYEFGDVITTSPEMIEAMLRQVLESGLPDNEEVRMLNKIALVWRLRKGDYRIGEIEFLDLLASHGIGIDELKEELNALNKRKATSKYMDKAGEKPFIVVDEGRLKEYILNKLKEVEASAMGTKA